MYDIYYIYSIFCANASKFQLEFVWLMSMLMILIILTKHVNNHSRRLDKKVLIMNGPK